MPKYKVGDVAALFPNPPKPKTESGKKIQSLFEEFYNKPSKPSKKRKSQNQFEGKEKPIEDSVSEEKSEAMAEKQPKKKKRKFQNSNISKSVEDTTTPHIAKKPKLESITERAPFPRNKTKNRNSNSESYLPKKIAKEVDSEMESFPPNMKTKMHSQNENLFPRKKAKEMTLEKESDSFPKKLNKKKSFKKMLQNDSTVQGEEIESPSPNNDAEESNFETGNNFPRNKVKGMQQEEDSPKKKKKDKKKAKDSAAAENDTLPDFLKHTPKGVQENSKVIFRMKKQRVIPSCRDVFENPEVATSSGESNKNTDGERHKSNDQKSKTLVRERVEETEERLSRTLFVGNLPIGTTKKSLEKLFGPFGSLDSCRLRGAVPQKSTIPRKIAEIKGKYHAGLQSRIAYVVLKQRKSAIEALSLSGMLIDGHHIVVDRASASGEKKLYDEKRSIFVGNLPFTIKDETLWSSFLPCGDIEAVRVIRDKETGAGKGFGYVSFQKIQGKENALALTNLEIEGRQLRIKCVEGGKKKSRQPPSPWKGAMKRIAKKEKKRDGNPNSRKTLRKLMKRGKQQHQKKKIAGIFKKLSRN